MSKVKAQNYLHSLRLYFRIPFAYCLTSNSNVFDEASPVLTIPVAFILTGVSRLTVIACTEERLSTFQLASVTGTAIETVCTV